MRLINELRRVFKIAVVGFRIIGDRSLKCNGAPITVGMIDIPVAAQNLFSSSAARYSNRSRLHK